MKIDPYIVSDGIVTFALGRTV